MSGSAGRSPTRAVAGGSPESESEVLTLLRAVAQADGGATQRTVAEALKIPKAQARHELLALKRVGLLGETVDDRPEARGRRVFWLTPGRGRSELERLERAAAGE